MSVVFSASQLIFWMIMFYEQKAIGNKRVYASITILLLFAMTTDFIYGPFIIVDRDIDIAISMILYIIIFVFTFLYLKCVLQGESDDASVKDSN